MLAVKRPTSRSDSKPIIVPIDRLSSTALDQLIEEFVTRSGTDYGETECPLAKKKRAVYEQLLSGEIVVIYNLEMQTSDIVVRRSLSAQLKDS